jgi:hypothetical protein
MLIHDQAQCIFVDLKSKYGECQCAAAAAAAAETLSASYALFL